MNTQSTTKVSKKVQAKVNIPAYFIAAYECAVLRDGEDVTKSYDPQAALQTYFNDLFQVFLVKIAAIPVETSLTAQQEQRTQDMLKELLKVKRMLNGSTEEPL